MASWSYSLVDTAGQFTWRFADFDNGDAAQLECWFKRTGVSTGVIHLNNGFTADITSANVKTMEFNAQFSTHSVHGWLRREVPDADCMLGAKFWNGTSFEDYSPQDSTQIIEAKKSGWAATAVFVNHSVHYRISFFPHPIQTRVDTGAQRPVYIPLKPTIPIIDYPAVDENLYASFCLDGLPDALVEQIRCPITLTLMRQPVIAPDGFTYEFAAIKKWLEKHDTSPATNGRLESKRLIINHAVRKMIAGMVAGQIRVVRKKNKEVASSEVEADQTEPKKKKKKKTPTEKAAEAFAAANP